MMEFEMRTMTGFMVLFVGGFMLTFLATGVVMGCIRRALRRRRLRWLTAALEDGRRMMDALPADMVAVGDVQAADVAFEHYDRLWRDYWIADNTLEDELETETPMSGMTAGVRTATECDGGEGRGRTMKSERERARARSVTEAFLAGRLERSERERVLAILDALKGIQASLARIEKFYDGRPWGGTA